MAQREVIVAALIDLEDSTGRLTPTIVVESARVPSSPLHSSFEWDDTVAAHQHRLDQARRLITSVHYEVTYDTVTLLCPLYLRDPRAAAREQGYQQIVKIRTKEDDAHETLAEEMARVRAALKRAKTIALILDQSGALEEIDAQVEQFVRELQAMRDRAAAARAESEEAPEPEPMPPPPPTRPRGRPRKGGTDARR